MSRQWENILRMAEGAVQIVLALAVLVLALISLFGGSFRHIPAIAFCGAAYNLLEVLQIELAQRKPQERITLFLVLAAACTVFGIIAKLGLR